jgi:regulator of nucleoside diphosphate kinase
MAMPPIEDSFAASLSGIWSALHKDVELTIREEEVHHLRMLALTADDHLVTHLLLRKLRLARVAGPGPAPEQVAVLNSFIEYRFDGVGERFCQLVHPSPYIPNYGLTLVSLVGAGLLGLRAGQTILWPNKAGTLCDLHVVQVENCPGLNDWLRDNPMRKLANA